MIHKEFELVVLVANFIDLGDTGGEECLFNNDPNFPRLAFPLLINHALLVTSLSAHHR